MPGNRNNVRAAAVQMFLLGLFSLTRIYFVIGTVFISELLCDIIAPFLMLKCWRRMRREGFALYVYLVIAMVIGLFASSLYNHAGLKDIYKNAINYYALISFFVVFYHLIGKNMRSLGWFFLGFAISGVITIWVLNVTVVDADMYGGKMYGEASVEDVTSYALFWTNKIKGFGQIPIIWSYLGTPLLYSCSIPVVLTVAALFLTISGRGQSIAALMGGALMILVQKSRKRMSGLGRHIWVVLVAGISVVVLYKGIYSKLAKSGVLGIDARAKYEGQSAYGSSALRILMRSRSEFFTSLYAVLHHPIMGFGTLNLDKGGYVGKYVERFGADRDLLLYIYVQKKVLERGSTMALPQHSHIVGSWCACGILGLIFYVWYLWLVYQFMRRYMSAVPQWFGFFSLYIPSTIFNIFFSPMVNRWPIALLAVCMLYAKAIAKGKVILPYDMEMEARRYD